ncbi:MAG: hypothetical protein K2G19_06940 [Lachnospiraceae bacterium]|nr:hypothetical protein [Lachnospiraceae bacterium]
MNGRVLKFVEGDMGYNILFAVVVILLLAGGVYLIEMGERRANASFSIVDAVWQDYISGGAEDGQKVVNQCAFGMKTQKVDKLLQKSGVQYSWGRDLGGPPDTVEEYVDIERGRYRLFFDRNGKMCKAYIKSGSSRNQKFVTGMSASDIVDIVGEDLYKESSGQSVYWSRKPISGVYYGFVFRNNKLSAIWEKE